MRKFAHDRRLFVMLFLIANLLFACAACAEDAYEAAVAHAGRSSDDLKRDPVDHPAEVLRASGVKAGMRVADFFAADGYYSQMLSYIVGPEGHVLLINNPPYDKFANNAWKERIEKQHLNNVEHVSVDPAHMGLKDASLDAIFMVKVYHDLYWVDPKNGWPKIDVPAVLDQIAHALKPGGTLLIVDHSAKAGTGSNDAGSLHRIDEEFMRKDFESHGFTFASKSDFLRRPDDKRDQISYKPPAVGHTDRFVYVFRKGA
ncbi:MAG TPA: methyltransferase domain-containing protein [Rudaea sp.]|jgi:predicted methyltransferase